MNQTQLTGRRITIIGKRGGTNIGGSLERAALAANLDVEVVELKGATQAPAWLRQFNWHFRGHRPTWLNRFSAGVVRACLHRKSEAVIVTGIAGLNANALNELKKAGVKVVDYLTDDPWNPVHRAPWFFKALPEYFAVFSPRRTNLGDLSELGCRRVFYLPFAYDPELHFPEAPANDERKTFSTDVLFVGGADPDRIPLCRAIANAGLSLAIYGDYWGRCDSTRPFWRGYADLPTLRKATGEAKVCLCVTRKANRDGHTMRSYEVPAMGGAILAEATDDHLEIFGEEGALYFHNIPEMITKATWLIAHKGEARQMAERARARIINGANTYRDRLQTILAECLN